MEPMGRVARIIVVLITLLLSADLGAQPAGAFVQFSGNQTFPAEELRSAIAREIAGAAPTPDAITDLIDAAFTLESWYNEQGFPDAVVRVRLVDQSGDGTSRLITSPGEYAQVDSVTYEIDEGTRLYLGEVDFEGNRAFGDTTLARYVPRQGGLLLGAGRALFRPADMNAISDSVTQHYRQAGYLRAEVGPASTQRDGNTIDVLVPIVEGSVFLVGASTLTGTEFLEQDLVASLEAARPEPGVRFTERTVADAARAMETRLSAEGYLTGVRYNVEIRDSESRVDLLFSVQPSGRSLAGELRVRSESAEPLRIRPAVVARQFRLEQGAPVDRLAVEAARRRLYQTGLFRIVQIEYVPQAPGTVSPGEDQVVDIVVDLQEAQQRTLSVSAGYSTTDQVLAGVAYSDENIFGSARSWSVGGEASFRGFRVSTGVSDALVLGSGSLLSLQFSYGREIREAFTEDGFTGDLEATIPLQEHLDLSALYELSLSSVEDRSMAGTSDPLVRVGRVHLETVWDTVDAPFLPTTGARVAVGADFSGGLFGSELEFARVNFDSVVHLSAGDQLVFTTQLGADSIVPRAGEQIPVSERLYSGGAGSVRAFPEDTLSPTDAAGTPVGGLTAIEVTAQLRLQLFTNLYLALFVDAGAVDEKPLSLGPVGTGLGMGLRYDLPVGPLRIDAAINPGPTFAAEQRWAVHIGIGTGL